MNGSVIYVETPSCRLWSSTLVSSSSNLSILRSCTQVLFFFSDQLQKLSMKVHNRLNLLSNSDQIYKIPAKILLKTIPKLEKMCMPIQSSDVFINYRPIVKADNKKSKFNFRFAGCRPVSLKSRKHKFMPTVQIEPIVIQRPLDAFNSQVVIAKRKLLKPVTNIVKGNYSANYHLLVIWVK